MEEKIKEVLKNFQKEPTNKEDFTGQEGVVVLFAQGTGLKTVAGTKVFLADGTEIKGVTSISMPNMEVHSVRVVTITLPLLDIRIE
jgi:hypothetical protein